MTYVYENPAVAKATVEIEAAIQHGKPLPACPICGTPADGVEVERALHEFARYTLKPCRHVLQIELRLEHP